MGNKSKTDARLLEQSKKIAKALELRVLGHTNAQIAQALGYANESPARQLIKRALAQHSFESVEEARKLELMKLERLESAHFESALVDVKVAKLLLDILEARAKYLGLHVPQAHSLSVTAGHASTDRALMAQKYEAMASALRAAEEGESARVVDADAAESVDVVSEPGGETGAD